MPAGGGGGKGGPRRIKGALGSTGIIGGLTGGKGGGANPELIASPSDASDWSGSEFCNTMKTGKLASLKGKG